MLLLALVVVVICFTLIMCNFMFNGGSIVATIVGELVLLFMMFLVLLVWVNIHEIVPCENYSYCIKNAGKSYGPYKSAEEAQKMLEHLTQTLKTQL